MVPSACKDDMDMLSGTSRLCTVERCLPTTKSSQDSTLDTTVHPDAKSIAPTQSTAAQDAEDVINTSSSNRSKGKVTWQTLNAILPNA